jgi:hypothetical protein
MTNEEGYGVVRNFFGCLRNIRGSLRVLAHQMKLISSLYLITKHGALDYENKSTLRNSTSDICTIDLSHCGVPFLWTYFSLTKNGATVAVIIERHQHVTSNHTAPLPRNDWVYNQIWFQIHAQFNYECHSSRASFRLI